MEMKSPEKPIWFDGKNINEALFCQEFLQTHRILFTGRAFFTPEGRVTDDMPLRGEIYEVLKGCVVSSLSKRVGNILEVLKLEAQVEELLPEPDRVHLSNGTLLLDGTFLPGKENNGSVTFADLPSKRTNISEKRLAFSVLWEFASRHPESVLSRSIS